MDAQPNTNAEPGSARERARDSIFLSATIWFAPGAARHEVRVRNISSGGMMIDFAQSCPIGSVVYAEIKGVGEVAGTIAWATGTRLGIRFDEAIDPDAARYRPKAMAVPGVKVPIVYDRRPGLAIR